MTLLEERPRVRRQPSGLGALRRLHFYAGVFVAPFLFLAAFTGLLYAFAPQLDGLVYRHQLHVAPQTGALPLAAQVDAARVARPAATVTAVIPPAHRGDTTQVVFDGGRTVYVDPYTARLRGELPTSFGDRPLTTWLGELHRSLHLGPVGRLYSETAASWLWVLAAGGLILWLRRRRSLRRMLQPDRDATGRRRTLSWHGSLGTWLAIGLLFLAATGLTWSRFAGARFDSALTRLDAHAPHVSTTVPGSGAPTVGVDGVLAAARGAGLSGPVEMDPPATEEQAWTVKQLDHTWPVRLDAVAVDPGTGRVTARTRFADWPLPAQLSKLGIYAHMGTLFGLANQVGLAALAVGIMAILVWGYRAWWQRRPTRGPGFGRPPPRGAWRSIRPGGLAALVAAAVLVGWTMPVLGVELLAFLLADLVVARITRVRP